MAQSGGHPCPQNTHTAKIYPTLLSCWGSWWICSCVLRKLPTLDFLVHLGTSSFLLISKCLSQWSMTPSVEVGLYLLKGEPMNCSSSPFWLLPASAEHNPSVKAPLPCAHLWDVHSLATSWRHLRVLPHPAAAAPGCHRLRSSSLTTLLENRNPESEQCHLQQGHGRSKSQSLSLWEPLFSTGQDGHHAARLPAVNAAPVAWEFGVKCFTTMSPVSSTRW